MYLTSNSLISNLCQLRRTTYSPACGSSKVLPCHFFICKDEGWGSEQLFAPGSAQHACDHCPGLPSLCRPAGLSLLTVKPSNCYLINSAEIKKRCVCVCFNTLWLGYWQVTFPYWILAADRTLPARLLMLINNEVTSEVEEGCRGQAGMGSVISTPQA